MVTGEKTSAVAAELRIADPQFNSAIASQYTLLLSITPQGVAYGLLHMADNTCTAVTWLPFTDAYSTNAVLDTLRSEAILQNRFKQVRISLPTIQYSLVPEELYDLKELNSYISFEQDSDIARQLFADKVNEQMRLVYSVDLKLRNELKNMFLMPLIYSDVTTTLGQAVKDNGKQRTDILSVKVQTDSIQVMAFSNGQLRLLNQYHTTTPEDVVYFLLSLTEQLGFNTDSVELITHSEDALLAELPTYFKNLSTVSRPKGISYHDSLSDLPEALFHNLFCLATCV